MNFRAQSSKALLQMNSRLPNTVGQLGVLSALVLGLSLGAGCSETEGGGSSGDGIASSTRSSGGGAKLALATAQNFLEMNDLKQAEKELRRAIDLDASSAEAHFELGQLLMRQSYVVVGSGSRDRAKLTEGVEELKKALELDSTNDAYAYWVGRAAHIAEDLDSARQYLGKAIELNADNGLAHKRLGMVSMDLSELEPACASFRRAKDLLPDDGGVRFQLGNALENLSQPKEALAAYEEAVQVDPTMPESYVPLARLLERTGDAAGAEEAKQNHKIWKRWKQDLQSHQRKVQRRPNDVESLFALGEQYFSAGRHQEALNWFGRVLSNSPRYAHAHQYCGLIYRELGNLEQSCHHLEEAAFLSPDSLEPKLHLILSCKLFGKDKRIQEILTQVEEEAPEDAGAMFQLAQICAEIERAADARKYYARVLELEPAHTEAKSALAQLGGAGGQ